MELSSSHLFYWATLAFVAIIAYPVVYYLWRGKSSSEGTNDGGDDANKDTNNSNGLTNTNMDKDQPQSKTKSTNKNKNSGWKCACEGGGLFLPASMAKSIAVPTAVFRMGTGGCYHKQMWGAIRPMQILIAVQTVYFSWRCLCGSRDYSQPLVVITVQGSRMQQYTTFNYRISMVDQETKDNQTLWNKSLQQLRINCSKKECGLRHTSYLS